MGITEKLFPFCNFRASCSITAPVVFKLSYMFSSYFCVTNHCDIWILNCVIPQLWHFHITYDYWCNKTEWTILKVVFLVFVPAVATNKVAKNAILLSSAPNTLQFQPHMLMLLYTYLCIFLETLAGYPEVCMCCRPPNLKFAMKQCRNQYGYLWSWTQAPPIEQ